MYPLGLDQIIEPYPLSTIHPYVSESPRAPITRGVPDRSFRIALTGFLVGFISVRVGNDTNEICQE